MRVLITGGEGQLASDLMAVFEGHAVTALAHGDFDIADPESVEKTVSRLRPDVILNTAAYHQVDRCEAEPESSFLINAAAPQRLARACARHGVVLVHFSTDYVFDGEKRSPYMENDRVNPLSVYGSSKAAGEMAVRCTASEHLIVRTSGVYGTAGVRTKHGNFVETMLRVAGGGHPVSVVSDQILTPTYALDLATSVRRLLESNARGTVHVTSSGECSWYDFAIEIFRLAGLDVEVTRTTQAERPVPARRPAYSVLGHERLRELGVPEPRHWREALAAYFKARAELAAAPRPSSGR